jgi:SAM-dependent methyltransferase
VKQGDTSFWDGVAGLPGLSPVIDYQREETPWARYITRLHLQTLARAGRFRAADRFLDYGCGVGRITEWLAPRVAEVVGLDTSAPMIAEARRRCDRENVRFEVGGDVAPEHGVYDGATLIWVLQHVLDDEAFGAVLDFLARVVKPGGRVYCIDRLCREPVDHGDSDYIRLRTRTEYEEAFRARGFTTRASHPVCINEQVLGRPGLTRWVKRRGGSLLARFDLAWARRQRDPFVADSFWEFERRR